MKFFSTLKTRLVPTQSSAAKSSHDSSSCDATSSTDSIPTASQTTRKIQNLVVASPESQFTEDIIEYALEMAKRMNYGIVAINAGDITPDISHFFSASQETLFNEFKQAATENVTPFKDRAEQMGIPFHHSIHCSDVDHAITAVSKEFEHVEFVISENREPAPTRDAVAHDNRIAQRICVYSMN